MPAYLLVNLVITDPAGFEAYRVQVAPLVARHGGRYLVRGGSWERLEGTWTPGRIVVLEFPDRARARAFYDSPEYQPLKALRQGTAAADVVLVDGV
jgi:uncharacterized protein (DUF1330 family)